MASVFLSYAREDAAKAKALTRLLEKSGFTVWWDRHIQSGAEYTGAIEQALHDADAVLVLWSKAAINSAWVRDEAEEGRDSSRLVPAVLDGCRPPIGFRQFQTFDLGGWTGKGRPKQFDKLVSALNAKAGPTESKTPAVGASPSRSSKRTALVSLLVLALIAVGAWFYWSRGPLRAETPTVAVLPFADLSPQRDKAYFAEGVAEEILSALAAETGLKVIGRTSARQIDRSADSQKLGRQLGVTHLLEGSARSAGDQLRVNVRLINTSDGRQIWEEEYQGRPDDVFAVQDQIAGVVVQRLRGTLIQGKVRVLQPTRADVYRRYLAARALTRTRTVGALREALELTNGVIKSDPGYAPGHALAAELHHLLSDAYNAYGTVPVEQARKLAIPYAKEAIRLAPNAPEGYAALGAITSHAASIAPLKRAIELDPSRAEVRMWLGFSLNELGRHDEALAQYRAAVDIDPLSFVPVVRLVHALAAAGRHQEALRIVRRYVERGGDEAMSYPMLIEIATWQADPSAVVVHGRAGLARGSLRHDYFRLFVAAALNVLGRGEQAAEILPSTLQAYHAPYYAGDHERLRRNIDRDGAGVWKSKAAGFAFIHLARERDWPMLAKLFDQRSFSFGQFCEQWPNYAWPFVMALRSEGRSTDADKVLRCLRARLGIELRQKARLPEAWPGELEFRRATLAALDGDRAGAILWLDRTVGRGWLGQPYLSRLADYPQFDAIRSDPRFAALQRRIDARIRKERNDAAAVRSIST